MAWDIGAHEYVSGGATSAPGAGAATLTGATPTVTTQQAVTPGVGAAVLTGYAPTVTVSEALTVAPGAGALVAAGLAPTVTTQQVTSPAAGAVALTGAAVTVTTQQAVTVTPGALVLTGAVPDVVVTAGGQVAAPTADLAAGTWTPSTGTDLYAMLDEATADDNDYIRSGAAPVADTAVLALATLQTPQAGDVTLVIRARWVA